MCIDLSLKYENKAHVNSPCSMAGFMLSNKALIVSGAFVGASGKSAFVLFYHVTLSV